MIVTGAYAGLRWGELAGLQWIRTYLDTNPHLKVDHEFGALHEIGGRLTLGPPKTPASVRDAHLPPFLVSLLTEHRDNNPDSRFVFPSPQGELYRRSNFRHRIWQPALAGDPEYGWQPIQPGMHFHDLRHTHKTWLIEDNTPRVLQLQRMGHQPKDVSDRHSRVTQVMIDNCLSALQRRWEESNTWELRGSTDA
jgi:integrase